MKTILSCLVLCFTLTFLNAQEEGFTRKGKILLETGYNVLGGLNSGTGLTLLFSDGDNITSIGADAGYFLSEDFALKFKLNVITGGGSTFTSLAGGGKYYIIGQIPVEANIGLLSGGGESVFQGILSVGYAAKLAQNIYLEPALGLQIIDPGDFGTTLGLFRVSFAMIL